MNFLRLLGLAFVLSSLPLNVQGASPEVVLQTRFDSPRAMQGWQGVGSLGVSLVTADANSPSVVIEQPSDAGLGNRSITFDLPLEKIRGARLDLRAVIKADNVAVPPQVWSGIKFMLVLEGPSGKQYPARDHLWGTFDWTPEQFQATVPADVTKATLVLGLEATTGRAWFQSVQVMVNARPYVGGPVAAAGRVYNGHPTIPPPARGDGQSRRFRCRPARFGRLMARQSDPLSVV